MSDFLKILIRKNSLRKQSQYLTIEELEKVHADIGEFLEQRRAEQLKLEEARQEKEESIRRITEEMEAAGLSLDDLSPSFGDTKKKVSAKYRLTDEDGTVYEWSGRGRTPKIFQAYFDKGHKKEDYKI